MNRKITAGIAAVLAITALTGTGQTIINNPKYNSNVIVASAEDVPEVSYIAHVQSKDWETTWAKNGQTAGTVGEALRLEALKINLKDVRYRSHVQSYGWEDKWRNSGEITGTTGQKKAIEAIKIGLTLSSGPKYDIYYRVHVEGYGWLGWAKNEEPAGTTNGGKRMEAIQIRVYKKGGKPADYDASKPAYHKFVPNDVFLEQSPSGDSSSAACAMMLRGRKFLDDNRNSDTNSNTSYRSITEEAIRARATGENGEFGSFSYGGYNVFVSYERIPNCKESDLKSLLDKHPEGIVIFVSGGEHGHAVYLTDYANGICCADPYGSYSKKRINLQNSYLGELYGNNINSILSNCVYVAYIK